jgi:hypothetical protein
MASGAGRIACRPSPDPFSLASLLKGFAMKSNVGGLDRIARIVVGVVLIALAVTNVIGWWGWLGLIPLITGLVGFCPLYPMLGLSTCPLKKRQ